MDVKAKKTILEADPGEVRPQGRDSQSEVHSAETERQGERPVPLLKESDANELRTRWNQVQGRFVDDPKNSVKDADLLVEEVMQQLTGMFADERKKLETQWSAGDSTSTEDLRVALQTYRSFFNRLLSL